MRVRVIDLGEGNRGYGVFLGYFGFCGLVCVFFCFL